MSHSRWPMMHCMLNRLIAAAYRRAQQAHETRRFEEIKSQCRGFGDDIHLYFPLNVVHPAYITLQDCVALRSHVSLTCIPAWEPTGQSFQPDLTIRRHVFINRFTSIACANRIVIGEDVIIAERCFISDNGHAYRNVDGPIRDDGLIVYGEVHIGAGSWIGSHSVITGDVRMGRHCVLGANSVLNRSIPDFCVAVGAPARIVKRYDPETGTWRRTMPDGSFE